MLPNADTVALLQGQGISMLDSAQALKPLKLQVAGVGSFKNSVRGFVQRALSNNIIYNISRNSNDESSSTVHSLFAQWA